MLVIHPTSHADHDKKKKRVDRFSISVPDSVPIAMVHCLAATELFKYSVLFMPPYETQLAYPHAWHNRRNVFLHIFGINGQS